MTTAELARAIAPALADADDDGWSRRDVRQLLEACGVTDRETVSAVYRHLMRSRNGNA